MKSPAPITYRPLEMALLAWAFDSAPDLTREWMDAKTREEQRRSVATMFRTSVSGSLRWLVWANSYHADDLRALMPYVGDLECVPKKWNLAQYLKALDDCPI